MTLFNSTFCYSISSRFGSNWKSPSNFLMKLLKDALLFDILHFDKPTFSMKIWSPVKVFRFLFRFKKALRTEFNINILDIFVFELDKIRISNLSKFNLSRFFKTGKHRRFSTINFMFSARHLIFVLIRVQTTRASLIFFVNPILCWRYFTVIYGWGRKMCDTSTRLRVSITKLIIISLD